MTCSIRKTAFTLLEILLVVLVVGVAVAAFLPVALHSVDQARTRSFLRQVISMNRYARSRAVLDRAEVAMVYQPEKSAVLLLRPGASSAGEDLLEDGGSGRGDASPPGGEVLLKRTVPETMRIRRVEGGVEKEEDLWILFDRDGVGRSYRFELVDPRGEVRAIAFNGFTGEVERAD